MIYGPGKIGKSELASLISEVGPKPIFVDIEGGTNHLDIDRVSDITSWQEMRDCLHSDAIMNEYGAVVVDSGTKAEELSIDHTIKTVPHEKGHFVDSIEGYGFGKGLTHNYETFLTLLGDLDQHKRAGRHVILICHECTASVPNPGGEDWIRYEPRLQSPASGKSSIRHRVKEWADHIFFVGYDTFVNREGKAQGGGSRTIYTAETPTFWAGSRLLSSPIPYHKGDSTLWQQLLKS